MQMSQIQAVNGLGSLLFLVFLLTAIGLAALIVYRRLKRRSVRSIGLAMLASIGVYAAALVGFSLASHYRILPLGTDKCFDDWCATVTSARSLPNPTGDSGTKFVAISLRISNRGGRAAFRPSQPRVRMVLPTGDILPSASGQREFERQAGPQEDIAMRLTPGESFQTCLVFEIPAITREGYVVLLEGPAILTQFLAGDENSFFHGKMIYPIVVQ